MSKSSRKVSLHQENLRIRLRLYLYWQFHLYIFASICLKIACFFNPPLAINPFLFHNDSMITISIDHVKDDFLKYLQRVESGETLLILRDEKPIAEIKPVQSPSSQLRPFGLCAGEFVVPDDFNDPLPEYILQEFEG